MKYNLQLDEYGCLKANDTIIVQLRKPYNPPLSKLVLKNYSYKDFCRKPSEVLKNSRKYYLKITDKQIQSLRTIRTEHIRGNAIYTTRQSSPSILIGNVFTDLFSNLGSAHSIYPRVQKYLTIVLDYVMKSRKFDYIVTTFKGSSNILVSPQEHQIIEVSWNLVKKIKGKDVRALNGLISEYKEIDLNCLDIKFLTKIKISDTDISIRSFPRGSSILVLTDFNPYYAGFISRYLVDKCKCSEVLPLSFFYICL